MGEYAIDQMIRDHRRLFGYTPERSDFESEVRTIKKPTCPKCGKKFRALGAVQDHMRDKHAVVAGGNTHNVKLTGCAAVRLGGSYTAPGGAQQEIDDVGKE